MITSLSWGNPHGAEDISSREKRGMVSTGHVVLRLPKTITNSVSTESDFERREI